MGILRGILVYIRDGVVIAGVMVAYWLLWEQGLCGLSGCCNSSRRCCSSRDYDILVAVAGEAIMA
jgi:hypothetical protein